MTGGKEIIGQACWMEDISARDTAAENAGETTNGNEIREESALQFIPRKRTNTNHVITPRKPLRQTTLNRQAQTQPLAGSPGSVAEKPARKRKSMRKSIRRSIVPALIEPTSAPVEENSESAAIVPQLEQPKNVPERTEQPKAEDVEPVIAEEAAEEISTIPTTEINAEDIKIPLNDEAEQVQELSSSETPFMQAEQGMTVKARPSRRKSTRRSIRKSMATPRKQISLPTATDSFKPTPQSTEHEHQEQSLVKHSVDEQFELSSSAHTETVKIPLNDYESKTHAVGEMDESASLPSSEAHPILESVEVDLEADANRPVKPTGSPKKRRASSVRRGIRRSMRTTRASSAKAEEQAFQGTSASETVEQQNTSSDPETFELPSSDEVAQTREAAPSPSVGASGLEAPVPSLQINPEPTGSVETTNEESLVGKDIQQPDRELPMHEEVKQSNIEDIQTTQPAEKPENPDSLPEAVPSPIVQLRESPDTAVHTSGPVKEMAVNESLRPTSKPEAVEANVPEDDASDSSSPEQFSPVIKSDLNFSNLKDMTVEDLEVLEPVFVEDETLTISAPNDPSEEIPESSTPNPSTSALVEAISENAPSIAYDHDDTDMLRNFLTRVKANKAAKAEKTIPKRKRSLPHSPLRFPLGEVDHNMSPSPQKSKDEKDEFDISLPTTSPTNRRKRKESAVDDEDVTEPKSIRRSGRTRLPVVKAPLGAPSLIPVRRLNQDGDTTITLRRNEEKELAALTRVNTRKNKAGALSAAEVLVKKAEEKDDPALRQRLLKEVFDEKAKKGKEKSKTVAWAEELARYQEAGEKKAVVEQTEKEKDKEKGVDEKKSAVRVGMRSKIALGMAVNGTPAPKRRTRERS